MRFNNILRNIILEQGRYEILKKTYAEPKKKGDKVKPSRMSVEDLNKIVLADPTTRRDGEKIKKAGTYTNWLVKNFLKLEPEADYGTPQFKGEMSRLQELFFEDLYKTTEDLQKFDRFKNQLDVEIRDINKLTFNTLYQAVKDFDLTKATTTKSERKSAKTHPGGEEVYDGQKWKVIKIEDQGELGKEAACFYGGNQKETRWCTSAPGLSYFNNYIKNGPLYVLIDKTDENVGEVSGLPKHRYQFHFPSNQFMDIHDSQIDLVDFLSKNEDGLKEFFKPEFMEGLTDQEGTSISVEYPRDSSSKFIALYGFEEFFKQLPKNLERLDFVKSDRGYGRASKDSTFSVNLPKEIGEFKNLNALHLQGIVNKLPKELGNLQNLVFLSLPNNPNLTELPKELANLKNLQVINLKDSDNVKIPDEIENKEGLHIFR